MLSNSLAFKRGVARKTNVSSWRAAAVRSVRSGRCGQHRGETMNSLINILTKSGLLTKDLDYHLIRTSMVIIFLFFGYQKWFEYEAQVLIPISATGLLFLGCTLFSASGEPAGFWGFGMAVWRALVLRIL